MKQIFLHVGFGKCGSSALQKALSTNTVVENKEGKKIKYLAITKGADVISEDAVLKKYNSSSFGYVSSVNAKSVLQQKTKVTTLIDKEMQDCDIAVLSNEGWCTELDDLIVLFDELSMSYKISLISYVRPPVDWLNSGWWQWGAWSDVNFDRWIKVTGENLNRWSSKLLSIQDQSPNFHVVVKLLPNDVVKDFYNILKALPPEVDRNNSSLPACILRIYQYDRSLRPSPHASVNDFLISSLFDFSKLKEKTPWVIDQNCAKGIFNLCNPYVSNVARLVSKEEALAMNMKPEWNESKVYISKGLSSPYFEERQLTDSDILLHQEIVRRLEALKGKNI